MSNSSPKPVPIAVIIAWISVFDSTLLMRFFSELMIFPRRGKIACVMRSRACFAEPPAESPSTMKSSASAGSLIVQSASLPGDVSERALAPRKLARLPSGLAGVASGNGLLDDLASVGALLLEELRKLLIDHSLHETGDPRVAQLGLRLPLELGAAQLDGNDGCKAFPGVFTFKVVVLLLQEALVARVLVERARQCGTEPLEMGSAF